MTLDEARKILKLAPDEDPRAHFAEFQTARAEIAAMIRNAPDPAASGRLMKGLIEFDEALAVIKKHVGPLPGDLDPDAALNIPAGVKSEPEPPPPSKLPYVAWFVTIFLVASGGLWFWSEKNRQATETSRHEQVAALEREGSTLVENRRWQDAQAVYAKIEALAPGSETVRQGKQRIDAGMAEEQTQFIGYWTGQATAELEAGRFDEAEAAARKVLEKYPTEQEAAGIIRNIAGARVAHTRTLSLASVRESLDRRQWDEAMDKARKLLASAPEDPEATALLKAGKDGLEKSRADLAKAKELLNMAIALDQGVFDQQALDFLREARALAPDNPEIAAQWEKQSSYTRTLHVPGDFATPAEALAGAQDRDRIVLAAGDWKGPLIINAAVELQGAGAATTRIQCLPGEGAPLTIGPDAKGARISGFTFRHEAFAVGDDRFSAALVRGGSASFTDCRFTEASGHGLAVIEGGQASAARCKFTENGWDGAAAIGAGGSLEVRESEAVGNFQHGLEAWDGATMIAVKNRCENNSRNGIHADARAANVTIEGNQLPGNHHFGLVLDSAAGGTIDGNTTSGNFLGGIVIRSGGAKVAVRNNQISLNKGPGLVLEKGLQPAAYTSNKVSQNTGQEILAGTDLSVVVEVPAEAAPAPAAPAPVEPEPAYPRATIIEEPPPN